MPAMNAPVGDQPVSEQPDVTENPSTPKPVEEKPEEALTEEDLKSLDEKPVPYSRFKEVNDKHNASQKVITEGKKAYEDEIRRLTTTYEAKIAAQQNMVRDEPNYEYEDEGTAKVRSLTETIEALKTDLNAVKGRQERQTLDSQLDVMSSKYPKADKLAVQGWKMVMPEATIEELMEKSHNDNMNLVKNSLSDLLNKKKERQNKAIPIGSNRLKLKESEKPKTWEEARKMAVKYLESN